MTNGGQQCPPFVIIRTSRFIDPSIKPFNCKPAIGRIYNTYLYLMKLILLLFALLACSTGLLHAQEKSQLYNPKADAAQDLQSALNKAVKEHKNVLVQVGGNWCIWCTRFNATVKNNDTLSGLMTKNYVTVHLNYSPENKNEVMLAKLDFPQRFGFPVFVILDAKGNRIHTQNSAYLEAGKGYDNSKIAGFLEQWSPAAIDPATYSGKK